MIPAASQIDSQIDGERDGRGASSTLRAALACLLLPALAAAAPAPAPAPVTVGLDLELGHRVSTSGPAIRLGAEIAAAEINAAGGLLGGRPLQLLVRDNRSVPARGVENVRAFAAVPDLVAVLGGRFSPVILAEVPVVHELEIPLLVPWAAADAIADSGHAPSYVFRLAPRDSWAVDLLVHHAARRGLGRLGLMLPNTAWGRSCEAAVSARMARSGAPRIVGVHWHNWGVKTLVDDYQQLRRAGAQAILLVAGESEGAVLIRELASLPPGERLPLLSHQGVAGGDLPGLAGPALREVDLAVVQFFGFAPPRGARAVRLLAEARRASGGAGPEAIPAPGGLGAAYDLVHLLARAVERAGSTSRPAVRSALEELGPHDGAVKRFARPFSPRSHEALAPSDLYLARYDGRGLLVRIEEGP